VNERKTDPIPEEFGSYEEAARFWDSHDTTDYPGCFQTVKVVSELKGRHYEIQIEPDVMEKLQRRARRRRVKLSHLANSLLRQQLVTSDS